MATIKGLRDSYGFQKDNDEGQGIPRDSRKGMIGAIGIPRDSKKGMLRASPRQGPGTVGFSSYLRDLDRSFLILFEISEIPKESLRNCKEIPRGSLGIPIGIPKESIGILCLSFVDSL